MEPQGLTSIWLVTTGEPLPFDGDDVRLLRTGIFFEDLVRRGIRVDWWTAAFDHANRRHRSREGQVVEVPEGASTGRIHLVPSPGYGRSVSLRRLRDHRAFARAWVGLAGQVRDGRSAAVPPDIVYCAFPTIAVARSAVAFGRRTGTPVVLDIRDLWPDVIWDTLLPGVGGPARAAALAPMRRVAARAVRDATAVIGLTDEYVDWALEMAGRRRGPLDVAIPVTYPAHDPLAADETAQAAAYWQARGVDVDGHWMACFLGTMGRQFDFGPVVAAARALAETHPDVRFVLCGEGDGFADLKAAVEGLSNVCLPGWVDGPERKLLLERSKVGLAPYRPSENFRRNLPNKPVEYFAHGLPVAYPIRGVLDRVCAEGACGERYGEGAPALADVLTRLRDDGAYLAERSTNARRRFQERHRPENVTDMLLRHRQEVLNSL